MTRDYGTPWRDSSLKVMKSANSGCWVSLESLDPNRFAAILTDSHEFPGSLLSEETGYHLPLPLLSPSSNCLAADALFRARRWKVQCEGMKFLSSQEICQKSAVFNKI